MGYRWNTNRLDLLNKRVPQLDQDNTPVTASATVRNGDVVVCTNTSAITITLPIAPDLNSRIEVIRAGTGAVTIGGNGETILGETTQTIPLQYDSANMLYTNSGWLLV